MNGNDRDRDDDSAELEETPSGEVTAPWDDPDGATDGDITDSPATAVQETDDYADPSADETSPDSPDVSLRRKLVFLLPRLVATFVVVVLPATIAWYVFVWYFTLGLVGQMLSLLGFAFLIRWAIRPHLEPFLTHPEERESSGS